MKNYCFWCRQADDYAPPGIGNETPETGRAPYFPCCPYCNRKIVLVSIQAACQVVHKNPKTIQRWMEKGAVSIVQVTGGRRMICYSSLFLPPRPKTDYGES